MDGNSQLSGLRISSNGDLHISECEIQKAAVFNNFIEDMMDDSVVSALYVVCRQEPSGSYVFNASCTNILESRELINQAKCMLNFSASKNDE